MACHDHAESAPRLGLGWFRAGRGRGMPRQHTRPRHTAAPCHSCRDTTHPPLVLAMSEDCGLRRRRPRGGKDASAGDQDATSHALRFRRSDSNSHHLRTATSQVGTHPTRARARLPTPFLLAMREDWCRALRFMNCRRDRWADETTMRAPVCVCARSPPPMHPQARCGLRRSVAPAASVASPKRLSPRQTRVRCALGATQTRPRTKPSSPR